MSDHRVGAYFGELAALARRIVVTAFDGRTIPIEDAVERVIKRAFKTHVSGGKLMFVGNGGSAAIASHMAIDYAKNGGLRATAFNDAALLTCLANDYGYDRVFARSIELLGRPGDLLIAISSSGRSPDILQAVEAARQGSCAVVTLSGFAADNPLRQLGDLNFYVPSAAYGPVEITHLAICHAILDLAAGLAAGGTET